MPAVASRATLRRSQQAQLQRPAPMLADHADAAQISGIRRMGRLDQTSKGHWFAAAKGEPPIALVK